jgi:MFS family permease
MSKEQSVKKRAGIHYGWICATGGLSSQFVYEIPLGIFPLVMASMMIALGMTSAEAGLIISMSGVTLIVGSPVWGVIVSRLGLRKALTIGSVVLSIGTIGMGIATSNIMAMVFYSITGFGGAAVMVISNVIVGTWFHARRRGVINGYLNSTHLF